MSDEYTYRSGGGCLDNLLWLGLIVGGLLFLASLGGDYEHTETTTNTRAGVLSGNQVEVLSRNQLNLWSDVQNCYGDYSCLTVISTTTTTAESTTTSNTDVTGERNVIYSQFDGRPLCWDPAINTYTDLACDPQGGQP